MSRMLRAGSFLFEPQAFKNDHAVRVMEPAAVGGYVLLLCELWEQPEPGVVPDDDRLLASLARMAPETWTLVRPQIARAFDTTSRPGFWIQKRMVATHSEQTDWVKARAKDGRIGGLASAEARRRLAAASLKLASSKRRQGSGSGSGSGDSSLTGGFAVAQPPPPSATGNMQRAAHENGNGKPPDDWTEAFGEHFWPSYPRKVSKPHALRAWRKIRPHNEETFNRVMDGLDRWKNWWDHNPEREVCYPATWLNGNRWENDPS